MVSLFCSVENKMYTDMHDRSVVNFNAFQEEESIFFNDM